MKKKSRYLVAFCFHQRASKANFIVVPHGLFTNYALIDIISFWTKKIKDIISSVDLHIAHIIARNSILID